MSVGEFNLARMDLNNEIGKPERSDERIAELNQKVNDLYGKIMADDLSAASVLFASISSFSS